MGAEEVEDDDAGGSRRAITKGQIESFRVFLPPLHEQKAIAHILSSLDDKIELNREMNKTLAAIARAIFKSWFVDFDPVHAKIEGKQLAVINAATAGLLDEVYFVVLDECDRTKVSLRKIGKQLGSVEDWKALNCQDRTEAPLHRLSTPSSTTGRWYRAKASSTNSIMLVTPASSLPAL